MGHHDCLTRRIERSAERDTDDPPSRSDLTSREAFPPPCLSFFSALSTVVLNYVVAGQDWIDNVLQNDAGSDNTTTMVSSSGPFATSVFEVLTGM